MKGGGLSLTDRIANRSCDKKDLVAGGPFRQAQRRMATKRISKEFVPCLLIATALFSLFFFLFFFPRLQGEQALWRERTRCGVGPD